MFETTVKRVYIEKGELKNVFQVIIDPVIQDACGLEEFEYEHKGCFGIDDAVVVDAILVVPAQPRRS